MHTTRYRIGGRVSRMEREQAAAAHTAAVWTERAAKAHRLGLYAMESVAARMAANFLAEHMRLAEEIKDTRERHRDTILGIFLCAAVIAFMYVCLYIAGGRR